MRIRFKAIFLIAIITVPVLLMVSYLNIQKIRVRKSVKHMLIEGVDKEDLVLLKFTQKQADNDLNWKHSKEFEYKGEMYDIVSSEIHGDTTYYYCWWDKEETQLNRQLTKILDNALNGNQNRNNTKDVLFKVLKFLYAPENEVALAFHYSSTENYFVYQFKVKTAFQPKYFHPPIYG